MEYYIYGLSSSENGIIRYVGQTKNSLKSRLNEHKCDALTRKLKSHKCNWIRKIYKDGFKLQIELIEKTDELRWQEREIYWIQEYRKKNNNIINQLDGGQSGGIGGKFFPYSYKETKDFIKGLRISFTSFKDYKKFLREHIDEYKDRLPLNPKKVFTHRNEWISWGDFFSNDYVSDKEKDSKIVSYNEAKKIILENNIKNISEYNMFISNRDDLPLSPRTHYKNNGWINHYDFFGKKKIVKCDYDTFCEYMSINFGGLMARKEYEKMFRANKIDKEMPSHPHRSFNKSWTDIRRDIVDRALTIDKK